jgi:peptidoglycan/xylan/chitin deacetylase (PgdA/CDA1 family)
MHASPLLLALAALSSLSAVLATPTSFEGVAHIPRRNEAPVYKTCQKRNTVALTFDDGPWKYENALLNELDQAGAKASFFV